MTQDYLENYYELVFEDEAASCSSCGNFLHRYSGDYFTTEYDVICWECFEENPDNYIDEFIQYDYPASKAILGWMKPAFAERGFVRVAGDFESDPSGAECGTE